MGRYLEPLKYRIYAKKYCNILTTIYQKNKIILLQCRNVKMFKYSLKCTLKFQMMFLNDNSNMSNDTSNLSRNIVNKWCLKTQTPKNRRLQQETSNQYSTVKLVWYVQLWKRKVSQSLTSVGKNVNISYILFIQNTTTKSFMYLKILKKIL